MRVLFFIYGLVITLIFFLYCILMYQSKIDSFEVLPIDFSILKFYYINWYAPFYIILGIIGSVLVLLGKKTGIYLLLLISFYEMYRRIWFGELTVYDTIEILLISAFVILIFSKRTTIKFQISLKEKLTYLGLSIAVLATVVFYQVSIALGW